MCIKEKVYSFKRSKNIKKTKEIIMARKSLSTNKKASELFTDREDARQAFWKQMRKLEEYPGSSQVIAYYGEGGIGKTWLLNELYRETELLKEYQEKDKDFSEITGKEINYRFQGEYIPVYFNLENSVDIIEILCCLRSTIFQKKPEFRFPVFDLAIRKYEDLTGKKILPDLNDPENKNLTLFEEIFDIASAIPGIGSINALYKQLKEPYEVLKELLSRIQDPIIREQIENVRSMETVEDLRRAIPEYFLADLSDDERDFSLVFFIDTFELFRHQDSQKYNDEALLRDILPAGTENVLWVFAGRYRIFDDEKLSQHLIGDLAREDAYVYLKEKRQIEDEQVIDKIIEITGGTPIFLDICVSNYFSEGKPSADQFKVLDKKELVRRYLQYQGSNQQLLIRLMSSVMHWKDRDFKEIFETAHQTSFSLFSEAYNSVIETTMIEKISEERRFLHRSVRFAIYDDPAYPLENKEKALDAILNLYRKKADERDDPLYYQERIIELTERIMEEGRILNDRQFYQLRKTISVSADAVLAYGLSHVRLYLDLIERYSGSGLLKESQYFDDLIASFYDACGEYQKAFVIREKISEERKEKLGDEHPETLRALMGLANSYTYLGKKKEALELNRVVYEKQKKIAGETDTMTMRALGNLSISYYENGMYEEGLKLNEENLRIRKETLGEEHPDTLTAMNNLALDYYKKGDLEKALQLVRETFQKRNKILGENHPASLKTGSILTSIFRKAGMYQEAMETDEILYQKSKTILGESHPDTIKVMEYLAYDYERVNRYQDALKTRSDILFLLKESLGEDHPDLIRHIRSVSYDFFKLDLLDDSIAGYEEALRRCIALYGEDDPQTQKLRKDLSAVQKKAESIK